MPPSPLNSPAVIDYLLSHMKKASMLLPGSKPGFNHAMKLSHQTMDRKRIHSIGTPSSPELIYRFTLSPDIPKYSTGLFTSLMDELSTDACFRIGLPSAPGLSLQFQTEIVDKTRAVEFFDNPGGIHDEVDIINTVAKLGRTIAHTRTDFRCSKTSELIAFASQVKYMPTGVLWLDFLLRYPKIHELYVNYALRSTRIPVYEEKSLVTVIDQHLQFHTPQNAGDPSATFTVNTEHTNPFGAMHGGCQAIVMENVALDFVGKKISTDQVIVEAMQLEFLSPGQQGPIDVYCEIIGDSPGSGDQRSVHLRVQLRLRKNNRLCTEGKLRISAV